MTAFKILSLAVAPSEDAECSLASVHFLDFEPQLPFRQWLWWGYRGAAAVAGGDISKVVGQGAVGILRLMVVGHIPEHQR